MTRSSDPLAADELARRRSQVRRLARTLGFIGRVEYRHVHSQTGGAQYGRGAGDRGDLLTVYAEAFERAANPDDFSLAAIVAHERGHKVLARHPRLAASMAGVTLAAEEVSASLAGALVVGPGTDRDALVAKATAELLAAGADPGNVLRLVADLWDMLGQLR